MTSGPSGGSASSAVLVSFGSRFADRPLLSGGTGKPMVCDDFSAGCPWHLVPTRWIRG